MREINFLEISIETIFMVLGYSMILYTSFVPDKQLQYSLGKWFIFSVVGIVFINMLLLSFNVIKEGKRKMKLKKMKEDYEKYLKKLQDSEGSSSSSSSSSSE